MEPSSGDPPVKDLSPARTEEHSRERVFGGSVIEGDLVGFDQRKVEMSKILDLIHEKASSVFKFSVRWEEIEELLNEQAVKIELEKKLVMERLREVEKKEKKIMLLEKEIETKQSLELSVARLVLEKEKKEVMEELEEKEKEVERHSKLVDEKSFELEKVEKEFDLKQRESIERMRKEAEVVEMSLKELEAKEKEVRLLDEAVKEKERELEKKEAKARDVEFSLKDLEAKEKEVKLLDEAIREKQRELDIFEKEQKEKAEEMEVMRKDLEIKEKRLEERGRELDLKERRGLRLGGETSMQGENSKRSRVKLLAEKGSEADSFIRPSKRRNSVCVDSASASSSLRNVEEEEVVSMNEEPEPKTCPDSEFNDFNKTMNSFKEGQVWALYDRVDDMPRYYARIKRVTKSQQSLVVTWVEPKDQEKPVVPVSCGDFKLGLTESQGYLMFSHKMHRTVRGSTFFSMNPRKGETWALFRDWSRSWNSNPELHKPPYEYDFVEILLDFKKDLGVGVAYLGKVEGFVSVFKREEKNRILSTIIELDEMNRFSHKVPSFRLNGDEKDGVPASSFELDPAALPASMFERQV